MEPEDTDDQREPAGRIDRRTVLKAGTVGLAGAALLSEGAGAAPSDWGEMSLEEQLEFVVEATEQYEDDLERAAQDGYASASPLVCGMGFHYVNFGRLDGEIHPEAPEALPYLLTEGGDLRLGSVEYILPDPEKELDNPGNIDGLVAEGVTGLFNDEDAPESDDEVWDYNDHLRSWTLHVWVHEENPDGVFAHENPEYGHMPGCQGHDDEE